MESRLQRYCRIYLETPIILYKLQIIDELKNIYHPDARLFQRLMIFSYFQHDTFLENWFLECVKKLLENPNTHFSCPEDYEDFFDDDSVS